MIERGDNLQREVERLLEQHLESNLSRADRAKLNALLAEHSSARRTYIEWICIHGGLYWDAAVDGKREQSQHDHSLSPTKIDEASDDALPVIETRPTSLSRRHKRFDSIHPQRHKIRFNAMTAVLTTLAWVGFSYFVWFSTTPDDSRPNRGGHIQYVAEITGQYEHRWAEGMPPISRHYALLSGERLNLAEGLIEITFDDGAKVVLEGPSEFIVDSAGAGTLVVGKLSAEVLPEAVGFVIDTPTTHVVDLGTRFSLDVNIDGATEVHVFTGRVTASRAIQGQPNGEPQTVTAGEAVRIRFGSSAPIRLSAAPEEFVQSLPLESRLAIPDPFARFVFHDGVARNIAANTTGELVGRARVENGLLMLTGNEDYVIFRDPPGRTLGTDGYTIALWIKFAEVRAQNVLVRTNDESPLVRYSHQLLMTPDGRLVHYTNDGFPQWVVGKTIAQPGQWYHVVLTAKVNGPMRLFVNGEEEAAWEEDPLSPLWGGGDQFRVGGASKCSVGYGATDPTYISGVAGEVRDVVMYEASLMATGIRLLYEETATSRNQEKESL